MADARLNIVIKHELYEGKEVMQEKSMLPYMVRHVQQPRIFRVTSMEQKEWQ